MPELALRAPLAYPAGYQWGFSPQHPAGNGVKFSGVGFGVNMINVINGISGVSLGVQGLIVDGFMGPSSNMQAAGSTQGVKFTGLDTNSNPSGTMAAIVTFTAVAGAAVNSMIITDSIVTAGYRLYLNTSGTLLLGVSNTTFVSSGISPLANVPYFIAVTYTSGLSNFVVRRLDNGFLTTASITTTYTTPTSDGTYLIGNNAMSAPLRGNIAAAMVSNTNIYALPLLMWSQNPWSFWYPNLLSQ